MSEESRDRRILRAVARRAMRERGFEPDFSSQAMDEVRSLAGPARVADTSLDEAPVRDLRKLLWCSIDNDDSRDLDQLTVGQALDGDAIRVVIAIADVSVLVSDGSAIDERAGQNTTSVYTPAEVFPMLPERLSTDLTSLNPGEDRLAVIVSLDVAADGSVLSSEVARALVHNHAKLAYRSVAAWLDGEAEIPDAAARVGGLAENLKLQVEAAERLRSRRVERGALGFESIEARPVFADGDLTDLAVEPKNRAQEMIEDFMIAANGVVAAFLDASGLPSLRRVVRTPKRWSRIVEVARQEGATLPPEPDCRALADFLDRQRKADPEGFPELSLAVVKLLGSGEYAVDLPGQDPPGHFGLAVRDYAHSTAPNRRYPDLVTQRLVQAALAGRPSPYSTPDLETIARRSTLKEDDANKVERLVKKAAAALLLSDRIGEEFDGVITGASEKGTWVRLFHPAVEGRIEQGAHGLDVGDRVRVRLLSTDVDRGFLDFARVGGERERKSWHPRRRQS